MRITARRRVLLRRWRRALGPAMARPHLRDLGLSALGAGLALGLGALVVMLLHLITPESMLRVALVAPLGASAFLIFAVPASPLAQPWSVVVGNGISGLVALAVMHIGLPEPAAIALAIAAAFLAMGALRAMHPPGGAMALAIALLAQDEGAPSFDFILSPVLIDSLLLVLAGVLWARLTRRHYPFRQPAAPRRGPHATKDPAPRQRHGLTAEDLAAILERLRLSANIGTGDYARLLDAAGDAATRLRLQGLSAGAVMSRDLITASPDTSRAALRALFLHHRIKSLPILDTDGGLAGIISQSDLIRTEGQDLPASRIMTPQPITAEADSPAHLLIDLLSDGAHQAVPVMAHGKPVGIITRSDLIATLAQG